MTRNSTASSLKKPCLSKVVRMEGARNNPAPCLEIPCECRSVLDSSQEVQAQGDCKVSALVPQTCGGLCLLYKLHLLVLSGEPLPTTPTKTSQVLTRIVKAKTAGWTCTLGFPPPQFREHFTLCRCPMRRDEGNGVSPGQCSYLES